MLSAGTYYIRLDGGFNQSSAETYSFRATLDTTDTNEVNNTFSDATDLELGTTVTGTIRSANDEDYFQVTLSEPGVLIMNLDPVPSEVRMAIYLYNSAQDRIDNTSYGNAGQARTLERLLDAGTYYILLDGGTSQSSAETYTFKATLDTTDTNEVNNTFSDATPLQVGNEVRGTIRSANDEDYFRLELAQGGLLTMTLDPVPSEVRMAIYLYDAAQNRLTNTSFGNAGQPRVLSEEVQAGTYYVLLDGGTNQSSAETYTFQTSLD